MIYRKAVFDDIQTIIDMGRGFWEQTSYHKAGLLYSVERASLMAGMAISNGITILAEQDGNLHGMMMCLVGPALFSDDLACSDLAFYVSPDGRRSGVGRELLNRMRAEAEERGCKIAAMVSIQSVRPAASESLFRSEGYQHAESTYLLVLK